MYIQIQSCFHDTVSASIAHSITEENKTSSTGQPINAMMPVHKNKAKTELWIKKMKRNFVKSPPNSSI